MGHGFVHLTPCPLLSRVEAGVNLGHRPSLVENEDKLKANFVKFCGYGRGVLSLLE